MSLQWEQGIPTHKRYLCGPRLLGELTGIARKYVVGKRPDWLSYNGGVEHLLGHLRLSLGRPQLPELSEYLTRYFRQSRRHKGESMNSYIVRKSELYNRAKQALSRVHQDHRVPGHRATSSSTWTTWQRPHQYHNWWNGRDQSATPQPSAASHASAAEGPQGQEDDDFHDASEGGFDPWRQYSWQGNSDTWSESWHTAAPYQEDEHWTQSATELLPDYLQGWYLLHDAGLDSHEKNMIQTAVGNTFSTTRISQELRAQWPEDELMKRDQAHKHSSFWNQGDISEDETSMAEPPTTATALMSEGMNDEGIALMASAVEAEETAMAALQQARRSLKEARAKQHQVKMSRQYYKVTTSDKSRPAGDSAGKGGIKCFRCGGPHKIANCPDRTAPPRHEQGHVAQEEAPFVCYAEADTEAVTLFAEDAYMTETRVPKSRKSTEQAIAEGYGIVDGGATKTLGSVYAMEALVNANLKKHQDGRVLEVDVNNQPVFGFGNSSRDKCLSTTKMRISANQKDGVLTIHTLDRGEGPVLLSIDTLRKLKAIIDFEEDLVVFRALDPNQVIQLERSQAGHRLLPLTDDLYKSALPSAQAIPSLRSFCQE